MLLLSTLAHSIELVNARTGRLFRPPRIQNDRTPHHRVRMTSASGSPSIDVGAGRSTHGRTTRAEYVNAVVVIVEIAEQV